MKDVYIGNVYQMRPNKLFNKIFLSTLLTFKIVPTKNERDVEFQQLFCFVELVDY